MELEKQGYTQRAAGESWGILGFACGTDTPLSRFMAASHAGAARAELAGMPNNWSTMRSGSPDESCACVSGYIKGNYKHQGLRGTR